MGVGMGASPWPTRDCPATQISGAIASWCQNTKMLTMTRLTITLSDTRYLALKEAAARRSKTIGQLIDESLDFYGIKTREGASDLVRRARGRSKLDEEQALAFANEVVTTVRRSP
jgi:hypothetical protein